MLHNPYQPTLRQFKGQLHTHTSNSGYTDAPIDLLNLYRAAGYDFVVISDYEAGEGGLYTPPSAAGGILSLGGVEEMVGWRGKVPHLGTAGVNQEWTTETINDNPQTLVDVVHASGGFIKINHPTFTTLTETDVIDLANMGYDAIEVYNALTGNIETSYWDACLSSGRLIWGVAVDDSHDYYTQGNKAWVIVNTDVLGVSPIVAAMRSGNMYASQGPGLTITVTGSTITAKTDQPSTIRWVKVCGETFRTTNNAYLDSYSVVGNEVYVRVEIERSGKKAWSQPLTITN